MKFSFALSALFAATADARNLRVPDSFGNLEVERSLLLHGNALRGLAAAPARSLAVASARSLAAAPARELMHDDGYRELREQPSEARNLMVARNLQRGYGYSGPTKKSCGKYLRWGCKVDANPGGI